MTDQSNKLISEVCRKAYGDAASLYAEILPDLGDLAFGYKILYGPPVFRPPIMFIGFQPGGDSKDAAIGERMGERDGWPDVNEYATASWRLASRMREIWGRDFLSECVATNANFVRSPDKNCWKLVPLALRRRIEVKCQEILRSLIEALEPQSVVLVGFSNLPAFKPGEISLLGNSGRRLVQSGSLWGCKAFEVMHLSGAHISNVDRALLTSFLRANTSAQ